MTLVLLFALRAGVQIARAVTPPVTCAHALDRPTSARSVQSRKNRTRTLGNYDTYFLQWYGDHRATQDLMAETIGTSAAPLTFTEFLRTWRRRLSQDLRWAEVGAGYALPFRQIQRAYPELSRTLRTTAVDQFDWDQLGDLSEEAEARAVAGQNILAAEFKPAYRIGDLRRVTPTRQHLITAVESIQYVADKVGAIVDLYNKLVDHGLLLISSDHAWGEELCLDLPRQPFGHSVIEDLVHALRAAKIPVAFVGESTHQLRTLMIARAPGTRLRQRIKRTRMDVKQHGYRRAYYPVPPSESTIAIERRRDRAKSL